LDFQAIALAIYMHSLANQFDPKTSLDEIHFHRISHNIHIVVVAVIVVVVVDYDTLFDLLHIDSICLIDLLIQNFVSP
jgi:hypothetical protein